MPGIREATTRVLTHGQAAWNARILLADLLEELGRVTGVANPGGLVFFAYSNFGPPSVSHYKILEWPDLYDIASLLIGYGVDLPGNTRPSSVYAGPWADSGSTGQGLVIVNLPMQPSVLDRMSAGLLSQSKARATGYWRQSEHGKPNRMRIRIPHA